VILTLLRTLQKHFVIGFFALLRVFGPSWCKYILGRISCTLIRPFTGLRPAPGRAAEVAAPPYDVLTTEEARAAAAGKPWSFLHISKPEIDLPPGTDVHAPEVYAKAAENLKRMLAQKVLERDPNPCYYAYRLIMDGHAQTGMVVAAAIAEYDRNPHPQTRVHPSLTRKMTASGRSKR
jgi:uncharacterized protein (DUF1015 family)